MTRFYPMIACLLLGGCSWLAGPGAPIVASAVDVVASKLLEHAGRELDDVPHNCEIENAPADGKLLMLCTFCYRLTPGDACR